MYLKTLSRAIYIDSIKIPEELESNHQFYFTCFEIYMEADMFLSVAITFLILSIITGVLGFGVLAGDAAWAARAFFFVFLVTFGVSLVMTGGQSNHKNT